MGFICLLLNWFSLLCICIRFLSTLTTYRNGQLSHSTNQITFLICHFGLNLLINRKLISYQLHKYLALAPMLKTSFCILQVHRGWLSEPTLKSIIRFPSHWFVFLANTISQPISRWLFRLKALNRNQFGTNHFRSPWVSPSDLAIHITVIRRRGRVVTLSDSPGMFLCLEFSTSNPLILGMRTIWETLVTRCWRFLFNFLTMGRILDCL